MKIKFKILCPLTEWTDRKATRGRGAGNSITDRVVLAADKYNWILGTQNKENPDVLLDRNYYGSIKHVFSSLPEGNKKDMVNRVIGELVKLTGKTSELSMEDPYSNFQKLGKWIDQQFGTSYHQDAGKEVLYKNLFKDE
jgi:hypothetical protein